MTGVVERIATCPSTSIANIGIISGARTIAANWRQIGNRGADVGAAREKSSRTKRQQRNAHVHVPSVVSR
jgi:hypothetical protein